MTQAQAGLKANGVKAVHADAGKLVSALETALVASQPVADRRRGVTRLTAKAGYASLLRQCSSLKSCGVKPKRLSKALESCAPVE